MDLFENLPHIFTVTELTKKVRHLLEESFPQVCVQGEISNISMPISGHTYFTLKDKESQLNAVLFKGNGEKVKFKLEDGLEVICFGTVTVYQPRGQYQIIVERIEPRGLGALQLAFWQLRKKLEKEGLFDKSHKKPIPFLPVRIGIVTSPTGKAIRDILNIINRRFSNLQIFLAPVKVQGEKAAKEIAESINMFNRYGKVDVIITGRGGGSLEDLWPFNEEIVARAIYDSEIPIISAVGHEPDVTIADLVADLRAPTPSAAAELVVNKKKELQDNIKNLLLKLHRIVTFQLDVFDKRLKKMTDTYFFKKHVYNLLLQYQQKVDDTVKNIDIKVMHELKLEQERFRTLVAKLNSLSPLSILSRGYSITMKIPDEEIIKNSKLVKKGDRIKTNLNKGKIISRVEKILEDSLPC